MNVDLHINKVYEDNDIKTKDTKGEKLRVLSMSLHNKKNLPKGRYSLTLKISQNK